MGVRLVFLALALALMTGPAQAAPLVSWLAGSLAGSLGLATGSFGFTLLNTALSLGASMAFSALGKSLGQKKAGSPDLLREAQVPASLPAKRFVYGAPRITGAPAWRSQGGYLYCAMVVNSRPSEAFTGLRLDKRPVTLTGDPYDMAGSGAVASAAPFAGYVTVWVGRGDQTAAPLTITTEAPGLFLSTDAGTGLTVVWLRLDAGPNASRADRWPAFPPEVEIEGQFAKVYDPREVAQDPDDPDTWTYSANQALCVLDALRFNPIQPYPISQLRLDLFSEAADIADESVSLQAGGTEPRYELHGGLVFSGAELMEQLLPLFAAGASDPVRIGGKLGIIPGAYSAPVLSLTEITEAEGLEFQSLKPGRDLATTVRCTFTDPARDWRTSELADYTVPGAQAADGGLLKSVELALPLVKSATQAMRIQKIVAHRQRAQRQITATLPPSAFSLIAGSNATVAFPSPYAALNGVYRVVSAKPGLWAGEEGGGVAMRVPVVMEEIAAADFAWTPATDEQTRPAVSFDGTVPVMGEPGAVTTTTGAAVAIWTGTTYAPAIRFAFYPSASASAVLYEWQYRVGTGPWTPGGTIDADIRDGGGQVFGFLTGVSLGLSYTLRARAIGASASAFVTSAPVTVTLAGARYDANFAAGSYALDGASVSVTALLSIVRASIGTYLDGSGLIQTAAANVARIDHQGGTPALLIEAARTNQALYSADLNNAAWIATSASKATATSVISGYSACRLTEVAATANHVLRQDRTITSGQVQTVSVIAKAGSGSARWLAVSMHSAADATKWVAARFDLSTGTLASTNATGAGYTLSGTEVLDLGGGWYCCALSGVIDTATDFRARIGLASASATYSASQGGSQSYAGDGASNLILAGVQFEDAATASSFIPTTSAAVTRAAEGPGMQGLIGALDLIATYGDGSTAAFDAAPVVAGYWPALTQSRLRRLIGTI